MTEYALEIRTVEGIADSAFLDRLADLVYDLPNLIDPLLALNDDGSVSASVGVVEPNALEAARHAVAVFAQAVVEAGPLRTPDQGGADDGTATVGRFAVAPADDGKSVFAL